MTRHKYQSAWVNLSGLPTKVQIISKAPSLFGEPLLIVRANKKEFVIDPSSIISIYDTRNTKPQGKN